MMNGLQNVMRREAERATARKALVRVGVVTAYDPSHYAAKVTIQPEGMETGFLPVTTPWVGNGWGLFCPPTPGDVVDVHFQEGGTEAGFISLRFYSTVTVPLAVNSGEFWLVHQSGTFLKFTNDANASLNVTGNLNITVTGQVNLTATGKVVGPAAEWDLTGNLNVTGQIKATEDIYDLNGAKGTMNNIRTVYDEHVHGGVQGGGGNTSIPTPQM